MDVRITFSNGVSIIANGVNEWVSTVNLPVTCDVSIKDNYMNTFSTEFTIIKIEVLTNK